MQRSLVVANDELVFPVLPLRDVVVFPKMVVPLFVGRKKSILALETAAENDKQILLVAQKKATEDDPQIKNIYTVGTVANILQLLKLPDGTVKVLVEGQQRSKIINFIESKSLLANVEYFPASSLPPKEKEGLLRGLKSQFEQYVKVNKKLPIEVLPSISKITEPDCLIDTVAAHLPLKIADKQLILATEKIVKRMEILMEFIEGEIDLLQVEKRLRSKVENQVRRGQREFYLNEQMKAIQKELGELGHGGSGNEKSSMSSKITKAKMSKEAQEKTKAELAKLQQMSPLSAEASVSRNYIDWMLAMPWAKSSKLKHDLHHAQNLLNTQHYGLDKVKERILEHLAVQQRVNKLTGPVLCLVGPPGVGKTSLGESIAKATGRKYVRISLGGVRDEAEIRGHRRTYIGAMPGKILQKLAKVKVNNPLFLLDEIDKMAMDMRGDPASALLEVLDPEQNKAFGDHYLEVDYDLSNVMFVATANSLNIPGPLQDRMEVIHLSGYTEDEKMHIAKQYLFPKQLKKHGLDLDELSISDGVIVEIIRYYTREAGVRNLERELSKLCRKVVKELLLAKVKKSFKLVDKDLEKYLGVRKFRFGEVEDQDQVGQVTGLAWTEVGGEILTIETSAVPGKGKVTCTGQLGDVMQESIQAAMTVVRSRALSLGIDTNFYEKFDMHIHVPEGAIPKDGPSAGIGMVTSIVSVLTNIPVRRDVAMTGEITLRGQVLPIGGLKEKLLAAMRAGITEVIIPLENERDLKEIPAKIHAELKIHPVKWIDEVLALALIDTPQPKLDDITVSKIDKENDLDTRH